MWFSVVCTHIDNDTLHHSGQNVVDSQDAAEWVHSKILTPVMTCIVVDKSTDHAKPHFNFFFYHWQCQCQENVFVRAWAEKGIVWHIDTSSIVWTLIDNSKLANQIARLQLLW